MKTASSSDDKSDALGDQLTSVLSTNSSTVVSESVYVDSRDTRCRYWAKVVRASKGLPAPSSVNGAYDIPGQYANRGDGEMLPGDFLLKGGANHHTRRDRARFYEVRIIDASGDLQYAASGDFGKHKAAFKEQGMRPEFLAGSGDVAAMVRIADGVRSGLQMGTT